MLTKDKGSGETIIVNDLLLIKKCPQQKIDNVSLINQMAL